MEKNVKKVFVTLKAKDSKKEVSSKFEIAQANKLLSLSNSQWKLDDKDFKWNGKEVSKSK